MRRRTVLLGGLAGLTGCASLPTTGQVRTEPRRSQAVGSGEMAIDPNPPAPGASPDLIVQGFLLAMATYQPGYQAARQYLTEAARGEWRPEGGLLVYADGNAPRSVGDQVTLEAPLVASVDPRGAYTSVVGPTMLRHDFRLQQERGEWRIGNPPSGLLMTRYLFVTSHSRADVYFLDSTLTTLVPDSRYFPRGNRVADAAVRALIGGPSDWLRPAVASVIPESATLVEDVVGQGTVVVQLRGIPGDKSVSRMSLLAAQLAATLRQLPDVTGFRFVVDGEPITLPEAAGDGTLQFSVANRFDPVMSLQTQLFGISGGHLVRVGDGPGAVARPVTGEFGVRVRDVSAFAVSPDTVEAAIVSGDQLLQGGVDGQGSRLVLTAKDLLRPQFTVSGSLWAISRSGDVNRIVSGQALHVPAPAFAGLTILAFRVAPGGQRMAVVAEDRGRRVLGLVRIDREPAVRLAGWRPISLARDGVPIAGLLDVGWTSASTLVVLASSTLSEQGIFEFDVDGVQVRETGRVESWGALSLASSAKGGTAARTVVLADDGVVWQYVDAFRWARLAEGMTAASYPG